MRITKTKAAKAQALTDGAALNTGLVVGSHGRHCVVETADGQRVICHPRGKKANPWWGTGSVGKLPQMKAP